MRDVRTTLTIDDDLAGLLKRRARELGVPFKEAVNRTIRAGLGEIARPGTEGVGLAWSRLLGFIRVTTNRRVVARPLAVRDVMGRLQSWLDLPHVHVAHPSETHFGRLRSELERLGTTANLTTDAHLAVLAMERGYVLYTTDTDFARFRGLRWVNPCEG